jgi:hypothetical protein
MPERVRALAQRFVQATRRLDRVTLASVALAFAMWLTMALAESHNGPTSDEFWHVTRGVAAVRAPDMRINRPHPPLGHGLAMLPVSLTTRPDFTKMRGFATASLPRVASAYVKPDYARSREHLRAGRLMNAAMAAALVVFLVSWLRREFGALTALAAGVLYATCPIVLAHGALVTNDFALGASTLLSLAAVLSYLKHGSWWRLLRAGLAVSLLATTKVSGLLVLGVEALLPLVWLARRSGAYAGPFGPALLRSLRDYAVIAAVVLFAINAVYRFDQTFLTLKQLAAVSYPPEAAVVDPPDLDYRVLKHWPGSWPVPLPFTYLRCLEFLGDKNAGGHSGMWFGQRSSSGAWLYFPFLLLAKTQAVLVPLLLLGFVLGPRKMLRGAGKWLLLVAAIFLGAAMTSKINIGVRHVFPTLVCLLALGGRAADVLITSIAASMPRLGPALGIAGALSAVGGVLWSFPAYVGDFNVLIGNELGRRASPVAEDWGQDSADLANELKKRGIERIAYAKRLDYASFELENRGVQTIPLRCSGRPRDVGATAIHLTKWERSRRCYKAFRKRTPDFIVHHNILVFLSPPSSKKTRTEEPPAAVEPPEPDAEGAGGQP